MAGGNTTTAAADCSDCVRQLSSNLKCLAEDEVAFKNSIRRQLWRTDSLILVNVVLAGIIVGIGAYGKRYRYHPFIRFIFLGATTLFLPIISSVISTVGSRSNDYVSIGGSDVDETEHSMVAMCSVRFSHLILVIAWAFLIHIAMINTCTVVAGDDREGRNSGLPLELLVQGGWTFYLAVSSSQNQDHDLRQLDDGSGAIHYAPFALICAKIIFKYYALEMARRSIALGRNPRLIFGYMQQLRVHEEASQQQPSDPPTPPPLLVMGEDASHVKKQPNGYAFEDDLVASASSKTNGLVVTIDSVWQDKDKMLLITSSGAQVKYICLSFSLFKLLRCRFARYNVSKVSTAGTLRFLWSLFLKEDGQQHVKIFQLVADELSFLDDYYYSSFPISFSKWWLPILGISISLSTISYCVLTVSLILQWVQREDFQLFGQPMSCLYWCSDTHLKGAESGDAFGRVIIDAIAACLLIALVMISEVKDLASYMCSNWTKVALVCRFVNRTTWQHSFWMRKWVGIVLGCRCKLMKHWDEKIGQCSILVLRSRTTITLFVPLMRLLRFPERKKQVKVPEAVKVCIIRALRSSRSNGGLSKGTSSLRQSQAGERLLWACNGEGTSDTMLIWHIATCIFEVRYPYQQAGRKQGSPSSNPDSDLKVAATHLSRYCAYLMAWLPELLPDDDAWSKDLYKAVKKDADQVLAAGRAAVGSSSTPEAEFQKLVELLGEGSEHEVLKNGVKLGKQLVELAGGEEETWKLLASFWSEMILYVAPSDNLKGHSEAIARGGELITLLWTLLFHAGIFSRPDEADGAAAPAAAGV